jgi:hypothetical protein
MCHLGLCSARVVGVGLIVGWRGDGRRRAGGGRCRRVGRGGGLCRRGSARRRRGGGMRVGIEVEPVAVGPLPGSFRAIASKHGQ